MATTTTFTATGYYSQYYSHSARWSDTRCSPRYISSSGTYTPDNTVGVMTIPSLQNVDWTKKVIQSITLNVKITYAYWASTKMNFYRSPLSTYSNVKGSNYIDTELGVCEVPITPTINSNTSVTLDATQLEWFTEMLEKGTSIISLFNGVVKVNYYDTTITSFSMDITYTDRLTLSYDANGGENAPASNTKVSSGEVTTISSEVPTRDKYEFLGWATSASATVAKYQPGGEISISADTTLYAIWKKLTIRVIFHTGVDQSLWPNIEDEVDIGEEYTMYDNYDFNLMPTGYAFLGWASQPNLYGEAMSAQWTDWSDSIWLQDLGTFQDYETYSPTASSENEDWYAIWTKRGNVYRKNSAPNNLNGWYNNLELCPSFDKYGNSLWGITRMSESELLPPPAAYIVPPGDALVLENPHYWFTLDD